jgi:hypothetical protein
MMGSRSRGVKICRGALALLLLLGLAGTALAQGGAGYTIDRWTVDGGGGRLGGTGGGYALQGTVGQAEPGPALTGGGYTLVGGYWASAASGGPGGRVYLPLVLRD